MAFALQSNIQLLTTGAYKMKNLILLTISLMVLFSTSLVFACGDGQDSSDRTAQSAGTIRFGYNFFN